MDITAKMAEKKAVIRNKKRVPSHRHQLGRTAHSKQKNHWK